MVNCSILKFAEGVMVVMELNTTSALLRSLHFEPFLSHSSSIQFFWSFPASEFHTSASPMNTNVECRRKNMP